MFTGLIPFQGEIVNISGGEKERSFDIRPQCNPADFIDGESIAVNGVCLSVEQHNQSSFTVYASAETLQHTTLQKMCVRTMVNLERALTLQDRLGGHLVSGHVDCVATVSAIHTVGQSRVYRLEFPSAFSGEVIRKGSVALDGISLTVNTCGKNFLEINAIPDTQKRTTLSSWRVGTCVNMETDLIGKYVAHLLTKNRPTARLDTDFLRQNGFLV